MTVFRKTISERFNDEVGRICYIGLVTALGGCVVACSTALPARHAASGANLTIAYAAQVLTDACVEIADHKYKAGDPEGAFTLARKCAAAYDHAEEAAVAAAKFIDAWPAKKDEAVCAVGEEIDAVKAIGSWLEVEGVKLPKAYENAVDAAAWFVGLGGACKR